MYEVVDTSPVEVKLNGTRMMKQVMKYGNFRHPNPKFRTKENDWEFGDKDADLLIKNFRSGVVDQVSMLDVHDEANGKPLGVILDLVKTKEGVDAIIEVDDPELLRRATTRMSNGKTLASGVSSGLDFDFAISDAGKEKSVEGPVLRHVALAPIPWLNGMKDWETVEGGIAASSKSKDAVTTLNFGHDDYTGVPAIPVDDEKPRKRPLRRREDSKIDLSQQLSQVLEKLNTVALSKDDADEDEDMTDAAKKLNSDAIAAEVKKEMAPFLELMKEMAGALKTGGDALEADTERRMKDRAEQETDKLIAAGRILPKDKATYVDLAYSAPEAFAAVAASLPVQVKLDSDDESYKASPFDTNPYDKKLSHEEVETEAGRYLKLASTQPVVVGRADNISVNKEN